jgi:peptidoglycan lytic transglycosylase
MPKTQRWSIMLIVGAILLLMSGQGQADEWYVQHGDASWYGKQFHGRKTADGDRFSQEEMTAAHRTLPLGTKVMVENSETGKQVEVKINDRGPYAQTKRRIIDLSRAAADSIGIVQDGTKRVRVVVTEKAPKPAPAEETFYEVQVGAFEESDEANKVLEVVRERFPEAYIAPRDGPEGEYYRVRVGPFATEDEARQVAKVLQRQGHRIFLDELPAHAVPPQAPNPRPEKGSAAKHLAKKP